MNITVLDAATLGDDITFEVWQALGNLTVYQTTQPKDIIPRLKNTDIAILNKVKITKEIINSLSDLKLICVTATGFDNIDTAACKEKGIAVCNVKGYSTHSVAQVTVTLALALMTHLPEYAKYVRQGKYTASGVQNCLTPVFHELYGKTWGIVGLGNIGKQVAKVATAFGCRVIGYKRTPDSEYETADLETVLRQSDIVSLHLPLTDQTKEIINKNTLSLMKSNAILINVARGAVTNEQDIATAIKNGTIAGFGSDVYSFEPMPSNSPFISISEMPNVILTPHMAWGAYESRVRCVNEIAQNIKSFISGDNRNRIV